MACHTLRLRLLAACALGLLLLAAALGDPAGAQAVPRFPASVPPVGANVQACALPLGARAPAFTLPDTEGRARALSEWAGRPVVLNFWAFWCDTWKAELPFLRALADEQARLGFSLVAVSVDGTRVPEFVRQRGAPVPFPALLDIGGEASRAYGIAHVPTVIILDGQGRVRYAHVGYPGNDAVLSVLRRLSVPPVFANPIVPAAGPPLRLSAKTKKPHRRAASAF